MKLSTWLRSRSHAVTFVVLSLWLALATYGFVLIVRWDTTPGKSGVWHPVADAEHPWRLVTICHTLCPCSLSSLQMLKRFLDDRKDVKATIVFTGPDAKLDSCRPNIMFARGMSHVILKFVDEQTAIREYHAFTSGQTYLFEPSGRVRFSGGLTVTRDSTNASPGIAAIRRIVNGSTEVATAPVFGCALQTPRGKS